MTDEMFEFVDRDYEQCTRVNPSRQIKTKGISFGRIRSKFNSFLMSRLEKKLEKKVEKALTQDYTQENFDRKITKNSEIIARLEEKIKLLAKEDVPADYVSRRAIKLRKNMIANLKYNSGVYYTIGLENRDKVMADDVAQQVVEEPVEEVQAVEEVPVVETVEEEKVPVVDDSNLAAAAIPSGNSQNIDVDPEAVDRQSIIDAVNSSFEEAKDSEDAKGEDVESVVENDIPTDSVEDKQSIPEQPVIDTDAVRSVVDEAFKQMADEEKDAFMADLNDNIDKAVEQIRVSRNNARSVRPGQFDENGNRVRRKKYHYTPMTDEEIRQSQIKLGFDEHGNLINSGKKEDVVATVVEKEVVDKQIRDVPVVVQDRDESSFGLDLDDEKSMFDIIEDAPVQEDTADKVEDQPVVETKVEEDAQQVVEAQPVEEVQTEAPTEKGHYPDLENPYMTIDDYLALKDRIVQLQKRKESSSAIAREAKDREQDAYAAERQAREQFEISQANYQDRMERLRQYAESLDADCNKNEQEAQEAEERYRVSSQLTKAQLDEANRNNKIIEEIDMMIGEAQAESSEEPSVKQR